MSGYPTFILTDAEGAVLYRWAGYGGPAHFIGELDRGLADPTTIAEKIARQKEDPTLEGALLLARLQGEGGAYAEGVEWYRKAARLDPSDEDYAYEIFETTTMGARNDAFTLDEAAASARAALESPAAEPREKAMVYLMSNWLAGKKDAPDYALPFLEPALEAVQGVEDPQLAPLRNTLAVEHALKVEKSPERAAMLRYDAMPPGWQEDPQQLNRYAWWCFENRVDMERALQLALKAVELSEPGPDRAAILDTAAELCRSRGEKERALELMEQAVAEDPGNADYATKLQEWRQGDS